METEFRWIGPAEATTLLIANTHNRNLRPLHVRKLARDMSEGRWRENGEPIRLDRNGVVLDGQHRLNAIIVSGVRLRLLFILGLDPEVQDTIDIGAVRNAADALKLNGVPNSNRAASVARAVLAHRTGTSATHTEVLRFVRENLDTINMATELARAVNQDIGGGTAVYGCAAFILLQIDAPATIEFMQKFSGRIGVDEGHPVHALRNRFKNARSTRSVNSPKFLRERVTWVIKGWNLDLDGARNVILIRTSREEIETIIPRTPQTA